MKKYISALAMSAMVLSSCSDFLDVQPEGYSFKNSLRTSISALAFETSYWKFALLFL